MKTTIDRLGRVVIPKGVRDGAGLQPGTPLDVRLVDGHVEIEAATLPVRLERVGRLLVAVPLSDVEPLTADDVERVRQQIAGQRDQQIVEG
jgi:AbrB family looped-hinge helix DNA binding protein